MFKYVQIKGGVVVSTQSSTSKINSSSLILINGELPEINSTYEDGVFTAPVKVVEKITRITVGAFRSRLTLAEKVAIDEAAKVDTQVKVISADLGYSRFIDVNNEELQWGLALYVQKGLLTQSRLAALLNDGTPSEAY